jgi:hypothetical protein
MTIPTEPIGSIPRPLRLIEAVASRDDDDPSLKPIYQAAIRDTIEQLGTCDDCGFSPFCDDTTATRDTAFAKIRSRAMGTALAERQMGGWS